MLYYNIGQIWCTEMGRFNYFKRKPNPMLEVLDKSIKELNDNSKAVEKALETFLKQEGVEISEEEFNEIKQLTDTMNELDDTILELAKKPEVKKPKAKKKTKRKK